MGVVLVKLLGQLQRVLGDYRRVIVDRSPFHHVTVLTKEAQDVPSRVAHLGQVNIAEVADTTLAEDALSTGPGILNVGAGFPFKLNYVFQLEVNCVPPVVFEVVEDDGADTDLLSHLIGVWQVRILFGNLLAGQLDGVVQDVLQVDHVPLPR